MKYEIGDKVLLLHSRETGIVKELLGNDMLLVEVNNVSFPVYADQVDFPYFYEFSQKNKPVKKLIPGENIPKEKKLPVQTQENGVALSFLPIYDAEGQTTIQNFKLHLTNETRHLYLFSYQFFLADQLQLSVNSESLPFSHFYLNDILFEQLNDNPQFHFTFSLAQKDKNFEEQTDIKLKPKAKQIFRQLDDMQAKQQASFSFKLFDQYPARKPNTEIDIYEFAKSITPPTPVSDIPVVQPLHELDLHIEMLVPDTSGLSSGDILLTQLSIFQQQLQLAIAHHQPSMIVIHGIGKGRLREEIHEILRHTREVRSYVNQYHPNYGFGATEIFFGY